MAYEDCTVNELGITITYVDGNMRSSLEIIGHASQYHVEDEVRRFVRYCQDWHSEEIRPMETELENLLYSKEEEEAELSEALQADEDGSGDE